MSEMENDETIRVNIRTGTSTRAPQPRASDLSRQEENFPVEIKVDVYRSPLESYQGLLALMSLANMTSRGDIRADATFQDILERSMSDSHLHRNAEITLDIPGRPAVSAETSEDCTVCQCKFKLGEKISPLSCGHKFHHDCLQEWGKHKQECPLCRSSIPILER